MLAQIQLKIQQKPRQLSLRLLRSLPFSVCMCVCCCAACELVLPLDSLSNKPTTEMAKETPIHTERVRERQKPSKLARNQSGDETTTGGKLTACRGRKTAVKAAQSVWGGGREKSEEEPKTIP